MTESGQSRQPRDPRKLFQTAEPEDRPAWARLHLLQMQPVRDVILALLIIGLVVVGQKISVVTVPLLLAILLAYLFEPVIKWAMRRTGFSRRTTVTGVIALSVVFILVPAVVGVTAGVAQLIGFAARTAQNIEAVQNAQAATSEEEVELIFEHVATQQDAERFSPTWRWVYESLDNPGEQRSATINTLAAVIEWIDDNREQVTRTAATVGVQTVNRVLLAVGAVLGLGFMTFLTIFFFFFTATEWVRLKGLGSRLLPTENRDYLLDLFNKFDRVIAGFIRGRLTIAFLQAIIFSIGYFAIGVPGAFILGPAVAVLSIVPYLALVGLPVSMGLLLLEGHTDFRGAWWWIALAPVAVYFVGQALDDYIFTPLVQGKSTNMDTPTILFASLAGGALFGVFGLLIAIPIAACLKILVQEVVWPRFRDWAEGRTEDPLPID
jgi:predicted PurR-regulated permease PerM